MLLCHTWVQECFDELHLRKTSLSRGNSHRECHSCVQSCRAIQRFVYNSCRWLSWRNASISRAVLSGGNCGRFRISWASSWPSISEPASPIVVIVFSTTVQCFCKVSFNIPWTWLKSSSTPNLSLTLLNTPNLSLTWLNTSNLSLKFSKWCQSRVHNSV